MEIFHITSVQEYIDQALPLAKQGRGFRGVANATYPLKPGIGRIRDDVSIATALQHEVVLFDSFKRHCGFFEDTKSCLDLIVTGQHYGIPTRLLDWTLTPLTALFFACNKNFDQDGIIYILPQEVPEYICDGNLYDWIILGEDRKFYKRFVNDNTRKFTAISRYEAYFHYVINSFDDQVVKIFPTLKNPRMVSQGSFFTVHLNPFKDYSEEIEQKFIIQKDYKQKIYSQLELLGVHEYSIFPDLDGLASWLRRVIYAELT